MTAKKSLNSSRGLAQTHELYFTQQGAEVHEFYYVAPGHLRPQRQGWVHVGNLISKEEMHDFIEYAEVHMGRINTAHVRFSWANWKRYGRKAGAHNNR